MRSRVVRRIAAVLVLSAAIAACGGRSEDRPPANASVPVRGGSLVASLRSEPATFNRLVNGGNSSATDAITELTQATLVRVNRVTGTIEPALAERWSVSPDGRTFTLSLRKGVTFSDGVPLSADDVLFSFAVVYDPKVASVLAASLEVRNKPLRVTAPDSETVVITLPAPFAPGLALLDNLPILPKHQLEAAYAAGKFQDAWNVSTPPGSMAGLGPFVLTGYEPGQRLTFTRNPHYWRRDASGIQLPYLDSISMEIVASQDAELLRMQAGSIDLMTQADLRPQDYASLKRLAQGDGAVHLTELGPAVDANMLWFNLTRAAASRPGKSFVQRAEFRQAISYAVDRDAIVSSVYLGAATPIDGPVTPGNRTWYSDRAPKYPYDVARATALLAAIGLVDRNGDGMLEDASGARVRFTILTQANHIRGRVVTVLQEQLRQVGIAVDIAALDPRSMFQRFAAGDYDAMYYGFQASSLDPANNLDFWLSSGSAHVWNAGQTQPATPWERQIDDLMQQQMAAASLTERQRLFADVQRVFGENLPAICFVAPNVAIATSARVGGAQPALLDPKVLWASDQLFLIR
ncbi:MAG TPA: ABC transporter substrate-binding protein [Vicinamibacterales bacterium]|nr:ABC transporter substrate-binding protein [Vicinamibacterales bacterium]